MDSDPQILDGTSLFGQFHELWSNISTSPIDLPLQYSATCTNVAKRLPVVANHLLPRDGLPNVRRLQDMLHLEKDTWTLISALYLDRLETENQVENMSHESYQSVQHSEREIMKLLYEKDNRLREMQSVRASFDSFDKTILRNPLVRWGESRENTAHFLSCLPPAEVHSRNLVTELHPDSVSCTGGQVAAEDQRDNERFLNYLFLCIRGGDLMRAHRLCMQRGEFWRAASLEGWRLFHFSGFMPNSSVVRLDPTDTDVEDQMEQDSEDGTVELTEPMRTVWNKTSVTRLPVTDITAPDPEGNPTRILYKSVCWWNAEDSRLHPYDRAIYAYLSGNLGVLQRTLPASWTDLLWAHCRAAVEARVDSSLRHLLHTGPRANTLAVTGKTNSLWPLDGGLTLPPIAWLPKDWTVGDAFDRVESTLGWSALGYMQNTSALALDTVRRSALNDFLLGDGSQRSTIPMFDRAASGQETSVSVLLYCIFYATQQAVMLRDYEGYLTTLADLMPKLVSTSIGLTVPPDLSPMNTLEPPQEVHTGTRDPAVCQMLRFLVHFVLFLRAVEPCIQDEPCAEIIKAYLYLLMADERSELVANYASTLPTATLRIQWYSAFLAGITQASEREHCLQLAVVHGFDVQRLSRAVVRLIRQRQPLVPFRSSLSSSSEWTSRAGIVRHSTLLGTAQGAELATILQEEKLGKLTEADRLRIIAIDWLFFDPKQRGEALVVANSLLRVFVAMNCLKAAQQVLAKLPPGTLGQAELICENLGSPQWLVNAIREHQCLVMYLDSQDAFADWFRQVHANRPVPPPDVNSTSHGARGFAQRLQADEAKKAYEARVERWRHELRLDTQVAAEKLLQLLTYPWPGWLVDTDDDADTEGALNKPATSTRGDGELTSIHYEIRGDKIIEEDEEEDINAVGATGDVDGHPNAPNNLGSNDSSGALVDLGENTEARRLQMQVLRETCLTETCFLLVRLYQTAGMHDQCVELTNLVASERHGLYKLFSKAQLQKLMDQITESMEHVMANDGDPLGYPTNQSDNLALVPVKISSDWVAWGQSKHVVSLSTAYSFYHFMFVLMSSLNLFSLRVNFAGILVVPWISDHRKADQILHDKLSYQIIQPVVCLILIPFFSSDTPPGTKIRLLGTVPISMGFLILHKDRFQVLGGSVISLIHEWTMTKVSLDRVLPFEQSKVTEGRLKTGEGGPPPFVPFGSKEASALVQSESRFFLSLRRNRGQGDVTSRGGSNIGPRGRGSRRGGGRHGLGGYDPDEEDDPRFDPAAAAAAAGLPSRPSTGLTRLEDLMPDNVVRLSTAQTQLQSGPSTAGLAQKRTRLPVGCPILAQNMTGVYEEAVMLGQLSTNGSDKVVLVVYKRQHEGRTEEEEELVPLSLIRTLNKEKITLDMIPPAPAERARVYNIGTTGSRYSDSSPFSNGAGDFGRGFDSQSGHRGSRGRSGHRGFRSRGSSGASGGGRSRGPRRFRGSPRS
ncbi:hypothetical protein FGIG_05753 [Fasciola gigantica]|uniref:Uncharacterized protein n=1 Tax=Fasciola gigantica TaxID=46835 RepID=A0A504YY84_FASGI|nr:hypothetical protein FGIG_05753 [Fasciola gigantica]